MQPYTPPSLNLQAFNCPHCNAYANQRWWDVMRNTSKGAEQQKRFRFSICAHCNKSSYWFLQEMIYPNKVTAPLPNVDLPEDVKIDFEEARQIANLSPKGAAALLRLIIQKICIHLGEPGKNLDKDIGSLVAKGLLPGVQKALDIVRVVGNESVHPGVIDLNDNPKTVSILFDLINMIADQMITRHKVVDELFESLPAPKKDAIEKRDQSKS